MREVLVRCRGFLIYVGLFSLAIDSLLLVPPLYMLQALDRITSSRSNETLVMLSLIALFALAIEAWLEALRGRLLVRFSVTLQRLLGKSIVEAMLKVRAEGDFKRRHGLEDLNLIQAFITGSGCKAMFDLPWVPIYFVILYLFHPLIALVCAIVSVLLGLLTIVEDRTASASQRRTTTALRQVNAFAMSGMQNAEVVGALGMTETVTARWSALNETYLESGKRASDASGAVTTFSKFLRQISQILGIGVAAWLMINDQSVTAGIMIAGTIIMGKAMAPIDRILGTWKSFVNAREAYKNLSELLKEYAEAPNRMILPTPEGHLSVERLLFYHQRERDVLRGLNFKLPAGKSLGIIGPSASGKTSLARLLVGIYKPCDGTVRLDGADIYQWARTDLGQHIGYAPQNVTLFAGTVAENIARMADATENSEGIVAAAKLARVHEMILQLPKGYDTEVGDGGSFLSGGQRQQIGLARALFGAPRLVVLDEPNSSLDGQAEIALLEVFRELKAAGITLVVISHKPGVLKDMDYLLVLNKGAQLHFGPHGEVMPKLATVQSLAASNNLTVIKGAGG